MTSPSVAAETLQRARRGRPAAAAPAPSPSAPPAAGPLELEPQLTTQARQDEAWLRARAKDRYVGLERLPDVGDRYRWCATVLVVRTRLDPDERALTRQLRRVWCNGVTPAEALAVARATMQLELYPEECSRG